MMISPWQESFHVTLRFQKLFFGLTLVICVAEASRNHLTLGCSITYTTFYVIAPSMQTSAGFNLWIDTDKDILDRNTIQRFRHPNSL